MTKITLIRAAELRAAITTPPWVAVGETICQFAPHPDGATLLSGGNAHQDDDYSNFTAIDCEWIAASPEIYDLLVAEIARLNEHIKDLNHDVQAAVNEANWQHQQGDEYGSY